MSPFAAKIRAINMFLGTVEEVTDERTINTLCFFFFVWVRVNLDRKVLPVA